LGMAGGTVRKYQTSILPEDSISYPLRVIIKQKSVSSNTIQTISTKISFAMGEASPLITNGFHCEYIGYHVPAVRHRDAHYLKLEQERAAERAAGSS